MARLKLIVSLSLFLHSFVVSSNKDILLVTKPTVDIMPLQQALDAIKPEEPVFPFFRDGKNYEHELKTMHERFKASWKRNAQTCIVEAVARPIMVAGAIDVVATCERCKKDLSDLAIVMQDQAKREFLGG